MNRISSSILTYHSLDDSGSVISTPPSLFRRQMEYLAGRGIPVVTLAEALPIAVITRFIGWFSEFKIPVGGVIVNMMIDRSSVKADAPDFVKNRMAMQDEHMETIWNEFGNKVRSILPLFETEVRGVHSLQRLAGLLYA